MKNLHQTYAIFQYITQIYIYFLDWLGANLMFFHVSHIHWSSETPCVKLMPWQLAEDQPMLHSASGLATWPLHLNTSQHWRVIPLLHHHTEGMVDQ